jgi:hypothetical protein
MLSIGSNSAEFALVGRVSGAGLEDLELDANETARAAEHAHDNREY